MAAAPAVRDPESRAQARRPLPAPETLNCCRDRPSILVAPASPSSGTCSTAAVLAWNVALANGGFSAVVNLIDALPAVSGSHAPARVPEALA